MLDSTALLPVVDGKLSLGAAPFGPPMADALLRLTGGRPILVTGATRSLTADGVTVLGDATLLGARMQVAITARATATGASLVARFAWPPGWHFASSFAALPAFSGGPAEPSGCLNLLDRLPVATPAFLITSAPGALDPVTGAALPPGLSFAGKMQAAGILGLIGTLLPGGQPQLPLSGPVRIALPGETTPPLSSAPDLSMPWQTPWAVPGIALHVDIGSTTVGRKLDLSAIGLDFYTPADTAWMAANPSYAPLAAGSARLDIPSADIALDLSLIGALAADRVTLIGKFEGVTFAKLESLVDAVGAQDLAGMLPSDVQAALSSTLGKLSLLAASIELGPRLAVDCVSLAVGIPDLDTEVLPGFTVDSLVASFSVSDPFGTGRAITVSLAGQVRLFDAPFNIELDFPEVSGRASLAAPAAISLSQVAAYAGFSIPPEVPALTIDTLDFYADKAGTLGFSMAMADSTPWTIDLGPAGLTVADVEASIVRPAGGQATGRFGGTLALAGVSLAFSYQSPGDFVLRSEIAEVSLLALARELSGGALDFLPSGFDIDLLDNSVMIQKRAADLALLLASDIDGLGWVGFEARRENGDWGFAFGLDLLDPTLSKLPGLGGLAPLESVFHMNELLLLLSSFDDPGFQFVPASAFDTPALPPGPGVQIGAGGVVKGFNAYGRWTLDGAAQDQTLLRSLLGLQAVVDITLQVGAQPSQNSALFLGISTTLCGMPLTGKFGGRIQNGDVSLFIAGTLTSHIGAQAQSWQLSLQVMPNGVLFLGAMEGNVTFGSIELSNAALIIGSDWEAVPSVGVAGALTGAHFHSSLAVFFDSIDPSQSLLAGSVSDLSLDEVVDTLTGSTMPPAISAVLKQLALKGTEAFTLAASAAASLDASDFGAVSAAFATAQVALPDTSAQVMINVATAGEQWYVTDLSRQMRHYSARKTASGISVTLDPQLYLALAQVQIAQTSYPQGFLINAALDVLGFSATVTVSIDTSNGIAADGTMSKIVLGDARLFSISDSAGDAGPLLSIATYTQPAKPDPYRNPHVLIDGHMTMLGLSCQVFISVGSSGFTFATSGNMIAGVDYDLHGEFSGIQDLAVAGDLTLGVGKIDLGPLGQVDIGSDVKAATDIGVSAENMWANFGIGLSFMDHTWSTTLTLNPTTDTLSGLPGAAAEKIKAWIEDLFKDVNVWARAIASGIVEGVDDVAKVLNEVYGLSGQAAEAVLDAIRSFGGGCGATAARLAA